MVVHLLSNDGARRIAIHAQLLDRPRPTQLVDVIDRPRSSRSTHCGDRASADLVLWTDQKALPHFGSNARSGP
jgi:hypothetical protein